MFDSVSKKFLLFGIAFGALGISSVLLVLHFVSDVSFYDTHTKSGAIYIIYLFFAVLVFVAFKVGRLLEDKEKEYKAQLDHAEKRSESVMEFLSEIEKGNLEVEFSFEDDSSAVGDALVAMRNTMVKNKRDSERRAWATEGLAKFAGVLRSNKNDVKSWGDNIINSLVEYMDLSIAGFFLYDEKESEEESKLDLLSSYAMKRNRVAESSIKVGEGYVGQIVLEKKTIYMLDFPRGYRNIFTGFGSFEPACIVIVPVMNQTGKVYGVVEVASTRELKKYEVEFLETICENMAITMQNF